MKRMMLIIVTLTLVTQACFRETGIEVLPVTASQSTPDNTSTLVKGTDASARRGDYLLQNNQLQAVINGDLHGHARDLFVPHSGGAIIDVATQYESGGNRTLTPRDDDGLNQLSQGVNMNRHTPIGYDNIRIDAPDETQASITLTGGVYDLDGSLAAAGATVDASGRVAGCTVTTLLELTDSESVPNPDETSETTTVDRAINYITMTTIISNDGQSTLPIYDINDMVFLGQGTTNNFVPYPDWGFKRPTDGSSAYPHYVHIQPKQINTTHYGFTSRLDGLLEVREERVEELVSDILYVGKAVTPSQGLTAGEQVTYRREFFAQSTGSNTQSIIATAAFFLALEDILVETEDTNNLFHALGRTSVAIRGDDDRDQLNGEMTVEYIDDVKYFDGTQYKDLEDGRTYPIFGDSPMIVGTTSTLSYSLFVPGGTIALRVKGLNSDEFYRDFRVIALEDENGDPILDEDDNVITQEVPIVVVPADDPQDAEDIFMGSFLAVQTHKDIRFSVDDLEARDQYGRVTVERVDDSGDPLSLGEFPTDRQGNFYYVDQTNTAGSSGSSRVFVPPGIYEMLVSRGPLSNVNVIRVNNQDEEPADSEDPQFDDLFNVELGPALSLNGYLSADFDIRGAGDPAGQVAELQQILLAYAEDLDVLFIGNTNARSEYRELFNAHGRTAGQFNQADQDADVDSWFDEVAYGRALATIGKVGGSYPDRGRFTLLNLPHQDDQLYLEVPLMESDPAEFYDKARAVKEDVIIHITRPRAPKGLETGFLTAIAEMSGLQPGEAISADNNYYYQGASTGSSTRWIDFDMIQILPGKRYDEYLLARADWFNLLNDGIFKPATGGSSTGETKDIPLGAVRTFVAVENTALRDNDLQEFWTAARAGNSFVTNGPIIEATINGAGYGQSTNGSGTVTANINLRAAPWIPVQELRVVVNGTVVQTIHDFEDGVTRFNGTIEIPIPDGNNNWVVFEAGATLDQLATGTGAAGTFGRVMPGHLPLGFTNPIFVN